MQLAPLPEALKNSQDGSFVSNLSKREIPSLNGLRGAAALAVVVWHYLLPLKLEALFPGPYAVTLFFELSGLLITWLLLQEIGRTGGIDRKHFYLRRALRLFPAFYFVWALCRLAGPFAGRWAYFFYLGDYYTALHQNYSFLTQAWSLGVEEKFYLLWPFVLTRFKPANLARGLVAVLIFEPIYRHVLSSFGLQPYTWFAFETRLDPVVLGCLIAIAATRGWAPPKWMSYRLTPIVALALVLLLKQFSNIVTYLLAIILVSVICRPTILLNSRIMRYFGSISYSLYLSHGYAQDKVWPALFGPFHVRNAFLILVLQIAIAIALASILHLLIERPFLRLKDQFHKPPPRPSHYSYRRA